MLVPYMTANNIYAGIIFAYTSSQVYGAPDYLPLWCCVFFWKKIHSMQQK